MTKKKFHEFREKLGEGYFRLDLPQTFDRTEVDKGLQRYRELRKRISEQPDTSSKTIIAYAHSFKTRDDLA